MTKKEEIMQSMIDEYTGPLRRPSSWRSHGADAREAPPLAMAACSRRSKPTPRAWWDELANIDDAIA